MNGEPEAGLDRKSGPGMASPSCDGAAIAVIAHANLACVSQGLAHEIGNALQAANLHLEMVKLKLQNIDPGAEEDPAAIALAEQLARIPPLVTAWVDAALGDGGEGSRFHLRTLVCDAAMLVVVACRHRGVRLTVDSAANELVVRNDRFATLHTTLWLIIQQMQFAGHGGEISLHCEPGPGRSVSVLIKARRHPDSENPYCGTDRFSPVAGDGESAWLEMADTVLQSLGGELSRMSVTALERTCRLRLPLSGDDGEVAELAPLKIR